MFPVEVAKASSTEEILVEAVYKLMHQVQVLEKKLSQLENRCSCSYSGTGRSTSNTADTKKAKVSKLYRVIVGTFRKKSSVQVFLEKYKNKIPARIKISKTRCRNWKCYVAFVDVPKNQYKKIKVLIPDAFISRTTLHLHTGKEQGFPTVTRVTGIQN